MVSYNTIIAYNYQCFVLLPAECIENDVLVKNVSKGVVMIYMCIDGTWNTLCDSKWSYNDASVACHTAGMSPYGKHVSFSTTHNLTRHNPQT